MLSCTFTMLRWHCSWHRLLVWAGIYKDHLAAINVRTLILCWKVFFKRFARAQDSESLNPLGAFSFREEKKKKAN